MSNRFFRGVVLFAAVAVLTVQPALAQSVLRDSETEALFKDISRPMIQAAGLDPKSVNVALINDPEINAFVATGQTVYIQSGLLAAADNVNQLQGVIAHELGHVAGGHSIRIYEGEGVATKISILSLLLGAAAMAAGAGEAGMGVMALGQTAAMNKLFSFSRAQESSADLAGASYLTKAGISGRGTLEFFKKLQNQEYRLAVAQTDDYSSTHPLNSDRIQTLQQIYQKDPAWNKPSDPALEARFARVKAKLLGYVDPKRAIVVYPESDQTIPAHYARAYAYHLGAYGDKAQQEANALLAVAPNDPYFLELKGQILLEGGKPREALAPLRVAVARAPDKPMIAALLGHALVATEDAKNYPEAKSVLKEAIARDNDNPDAWYQLGIVYDHEGDAPRAALALAEKSNLEGENKMALANGRTAMAALKPGSSDYLRAQDIVLVSEAALKKEKKNKK